MNEFIGHLHSLFLHLPIGLWMLFILLDFFIGNQKSYYSPSILKIILIIAVISSFIAIITGYIQSKNDFYPPDNLNIHQWIAYTTTLLSICYFIAFEKIQAFNFYKKLSSVALLISIICTVYFGTTLTHGEDFISLSITKSSLQSSNVDPKQRPSIEEADPQTLVMLQNNGWVVTPLYTEAHYYKVSAYALTDSLNVSLQNLAKIAPNIIELKLSFTNTEDATIDQLLNFTSLEKLWLDNTKITHISLSKLKALKNLEYLNLFGTSISEDEIDKQNISKKISLVHPTFRDTLPPNGSDTLSSKGVKQ